MTSPHKSRKTKNLASKDFAKSNQFSCRDFSELYKAVQFLDGLISADDYKLIILTRKQDVETLVGKKVFADKACESIVMKGWAKVTVVSTSLFGAVLLHLVESPRVAYDYHTLYNAEPALFSVVCEAFKEKGLIYEKHLHDGKGNVEIGLTLEGQTWVRSFIYDSDLERYKNALEDLLVESTAFKAIKEEWK